MILLLFIDLSFAKQRRRALYLLDTANASYLACSLPGFERYAAAYDVDLVVMTGEMLRTRRLDRRRFAREHGVVESEYDAQDVSDAHFGKLEILAHAIERDYEAVAYADIDIVINENTNVPDIFAAAALPPDSAQTPVIAMYGQGAPKTRALYQAVLRINERLKDGVNVHSDTVDYWNTGVMVLNRAGMRTLKALVELLYVRYVARGLKVEALPFFDQGFFSAVLWDTAFNVRVHRLSFAWNTSHRKYADNHGNQFWLNETGLVDNSTSGSGRAKFVPYLYHFMGCSGRGGEFVSWMRSRASTDATLTADPEKGMECKYKRMQAFVATEFDISC
jgi:hypothetical protein